MSTAILEKDWGGEVEKLLSNTYYSGTRLVLRGKNGGKAVLVSAEDLDFLEKVEKLLSGACHEGERIVLTGKEGAQVAIVPLEDLGVLEELEKEESDEK
ncbi:MAG: hypothetical protein KDK96_09400 [Chlamydiia bacterium]|nr:hypothetical protein [Chlamydiia bacterium]MCB9092823.1 hypothetical protein [Halobacteriovoraceae bacterium]